MRSEPGSTDPAVVSTPDGRRHAPSASLIGVTLMVLRQAGSSHGTSKHVLVGLGILSVVIAWCVVPTVYVVRGAHGLQVRYAHLYYEGPDGGIDFNEPDRPQYSDFAYLAFTIGMTFQVSDTDLQEKEIRATALQHALLSYVFGVVIIALTINLVAGLTK
jgi:uncharacterized membrane protein